MKIIATTNVGGMVIGKVYDVSAEDALTLTSVKRAKYLDDSLNPKEVEKVKVEVESIEPIALPSEELPLESKTKKRKSK